ncbi:hypothetical protein HIJ39_06700 [Sulfobacillus sp. DSM 109850]|uniref:Spore germination protein N-terminal domain-containing protein n=1 Tax=Sulfobacillus harzensis TaxID=2729629 RepID=A0A7Y0L2F0_9FIRM|nr:hypothetical protein [Sulfobacillus harzensis]
MSQLRRQLATPHLVFDQLTVGTRYPVSVVIAYLDDVVNPALRDAVRARVTRIRAETVVNSTLVASYLRDHPGTLFPTVRNSERVDLVVWQLLSGKVAVLVDGDPFVLWGPATVCDFYHTSEDYTSAWYDASFIRAIRWLAWAFGVYLPALYIALTEVNPELVPPPLVILTAGSHPGLPFTPIVEVLVMILIIEILREAALRLPKALGTTIGTVGAIVVGTAVVKAGFVSPQIIVVMTLTALSFFTAPSYDLTGTWRLVSWVILVSAFIYGVYGIVLATLGLTIKLVTETSFGVPYLTPLAPFRPVDWVDTLRRAPGVRSPTVRPPPAVESATRRGPRSGRPARRPTGYASLMGGRRAIPRIAVLGAMLLLLSGCWDQRPVEGRVLVEAVGVAPTTRPDTWAWTFVFPNPTESVSSLSSLSPSDQIYAVTVSAATWTGALLKAQERTTRDLYFGQFRVLAISPRLPAASWDRLISTFNRSGRVLKTFWIVAGHPAAAVVATAPVSEGAPLYALFKLLACHCQPYFWAQRAWQVWDRLTTPGVKAPTVPVITVAGPHVLNTAFATVGPRRVSISSACTSAGWAYLTQHVVKGGLVVRTPWGLVGLN